MPTWPDPTGHGKFMMAAIIKKTLITLLPYKIYIPIFTRLYTPIHTPMYSGSTIGPNQKRHNIRGRWKYNMEATTKRLCILPRVTNCEHVLIVEETM